MPPRLAHKIYFLKSWVWWYTPLIPAFERLRQKDVEFDTSLSYITRMYLQKKKRTGGGERGWRIQMCLYMHKVSLKGENSNNSKLKLVWEERCRWLDVPKWKGDLLFTLYLFTHLTFCTVCMSHPDTPRLFFVHSVLSGPLQRLNSYSSCAALLRARFEVFLFYLPSRLGVLFCCPPW
jgi:hypothetical protein